MLLERQACLDEFSRRWSAACGGSGQVVLVGGEAGIGKTALTSAFLQSLSPDVPVVRGYCDPLATPHALGPVFELWSQLDGDAQVELSRERLFTQVCTKLQQLSSACVVLIEDLHWADEATLDFVRYLGRRIANWRCLFIATYRDDETGPEHPLRRAMGDLSSPHVSRMKLQPLSLQAVTELALGAGQDGARVFAITGGNAFFVRELLSAPPGSVPTTVSDSMLARLARCSPMAREVSEFVALTPGRMETDLLVQILGRCDEAIDECVHRGILVQERGALSYRHELARRAIEDGSGIARRRERHQRILEALLLRAADIGRIVHHARGARDAQAVLKYAPLAAQRAARVGAHREAVAYYAATLEFAGQLPAQEQVELYERHAYECYLVSQIATAIESAKRALQLWRELGNERAQGRTLRFLSRQHWFLGDQRSAERYASEAIAMHERFAPDRDLAMAYSNRAQLAMLAGRTDEAVHYGNRAIELARSLADVLVEAHALNNVGSALLGVEDEQGQVLLERSLELSLQHDLHEHAARAYVNLAKMPISIRRVELGERYLHEGLAYSEERDLDSWSLYMLTYRARLELERGEWDNAARTAASLIDSAGSSATIRIPALVALAQVRMRRGEAGVDELLDEALRYAMPTGELQRIGRVAAARAEYAWLCRDNERLVREADVGLAVATGPSARWMQGELLFWKSRATDVQAPADLPLVYAAALRGDWQTAASEFARLRLPFERAVMLLSGDAQALEEAATLIEALDVPPLRQRLAELRATGSRRASRMNPHGLTNRELEILRWLGSGHTNAELARKLFVSAKTIDHHVSSILGKLQVRSRAQAVTVAHQLGLMKGE